MNQEFQTEEEFKEICSGIDTGKTGKIFFNKLRAFLEGAQDEEELDGVWVTEQTLTDLNKIFQVLSWSNLNRIIVQLLIF